MAEANDKIRSTFPIPASKLRARKWKTAFGSPVTWAPFLPIVGGFVFMDFGPMITGALAVLVSGGIFTYWKMHNSKLESKLLESLVKESNEEQDSHLVQRARKLLKRGFPDYASTLGSFLERKQQIENALHPDGTELTGEIQEVEKLTDAVVFGVADQLDQLASFDEQLSRSTIPLSPEQKENIEDARREISERVHEAYNILNETWNNLGSMINPAQGIEGFDTSHTSLDSAITRLKQEREISERVKERMEQDWGAKFGESAPLDGEFQEPDLDIES